MELEGGERVPGASVQHYQGQVGDDIASLAYSTTLIEPRPGHDSNPSPGDQEVSVRLHRTQTGQVHYSTVQYSTVQYSTVQYRIFVQQLLGLLAGGMCC